MKPKENKRLNIRLTPPWNRPVKEESLLQIWKAMKLRFTLVLFQWKRRGSAIALRKHHRFSWRWMTWKASRARHQLILHQSSLILVLNSSRHSTVEIPWFLMTVKVYWKASTVLKIQRFTKCSMIALCQSHKSAASNSLRIWIIHPTTRLRIRMGFLLQKRVLKVSLPYDQLGQVTRVKILY